MASPYVWGRHFVRFSRHLCLLVCLSMLAFCVVLGIFWKIRHTAQGYTPSEELGESVVALNQSYAAALQRAEALGEAIGHPIKADEFPRPELFDRYHNLKELQQLDAAVTEVAGAQQKIQSVLEQALCGPVDNLIGQLDKRLAELRKSGLLPAAPATAAEEMPVTRLYEFDSTRDAELDGAIELFTQLRPLMRVQENRDAVDAIMRVLLTVKEAAKADAPPPPVVLTESSGNAPALAQKLRDTLVERRSVLSRTLARGMLLKNAHGKVRTLLDAELKKASEAGSEQQVLALGMILSILALMALTIMAIICLFTVADYLRATFDMAEAAAKKSEKPA